MFIIYHNSRCKKSRAGLQYLSEKTNDFQIKEYLKNDAFTFNNLKGILQLLGKKPIEMIRKQEAFFKQEMKGKEFSDDEIIQLMVDHPKLINRPIITNGDQAVWGDPVENIDALFE